MSDLQINLLGPPEIRWEDKIFPLKRRIPRTLLFYLASLDNFVGREKLLTIFWEDSPADFSRRRLREALSRIRTGIPDSSILKTQADLVGLDQNKINVDQKQFLNLIESIGNEPWSTPRDIPLPEMTYKTLVRASCMWHGDQFLEGADLASTPKIDEWLLQTNQWLTPLQSRINERLSDHFNASLELENALKYAYKALASDKLNDGLHCKVLQLLIRMGKLEDAGEYYSSVTDLFREELNTRPSDKFISFYQQISNNTKIDHSTVKPDYRILSSVNTPFVARQAEIELLQTAIQKGGGIVISGESGLGKTRFVQEFSEQFDHQRRVMVATCRQTEINLPFQPIIELFRNQIHSDEWDALSTVWASPLTVLLPELVDLNLALKPPEITHDPDQNRSVIFEAIRQVFLLLAKEDDLIIFIDDAHWADAPTISAISYLIERPPFDLRSVVILALRPDELNKGRDDMYPSAKKSQTIFEINLGRLDPGDISILGSYVLGYPLEKKLVDQLANDTGGNPFIILETLRVVQEQGYNQAKSAQLPMAESVYRLIQNRIDKLSHLAHKMIEYAAVIGTEFSPDLVSLSCHVSLSEIAIATDELIQRHFIESIEPSQQGIRYRFIHNMIREALLQKTNPVRLRFLHKQIAQAMESSIKSHPGSQSAVLAHHFEEAGDLSNAVEYWLFAGQWARKLFSNNEAGQIFSHAEQLVLDGNVKIHDDLIHGFYAEWTEMAYETNDIETILSQNRNLLSLGRIRKSPLLIGAAFDGLSDACFANNEFNEGLAYSNQAISYINQTENIYERMNAYIHRGVFLYMLGRINDAIYSLDHALELSQGSNDLDNAKATANAYYQLAVTHILSGWPERGLRNALLALTLAKDIGYNHAVVSAYLASSLARYYMADYCKAIEDNDFGIELAKRIRADRMLGYLYAVQGFLGIANGRMDAAYHSAQLASELGEEYQYEELISIGCRIRGDIYLSLGKTTEATAIYQEGSGVGSQSFWELDNLIRLGFAQIRNSQFENGMHNLHRGVDLAQSGGMEILYLIGNLFLCYAHAYLGEWEQVHQIAHPLNSETQKRSLPVIQTMNWIVLGMLEINTGVREDSIAFFQRAMEKAAELHDPLLELRSLIPLTNISKRLGVESQPYIQRIHKITDQLESNTQIEPVRSMLLEFKNNLLIQL